MRRPLQLQRFVAAGFGLGWIPSKLWGSDNGAGTFGAALGGVIGFGLLAAPWWIDAIAALIAIEVSIWASASFAHDLEDPGWVVIDEVAGSLVAVIGLGGIAWVVAWVVARLADIYKVLPGVPQAEKMRPPYGITADDVVAGLYGLAAGWLVMLLT